MSISAEIQSLSPTAIIELFELDMSHRQLPSSYFHAGTNGVSQGVVWQGIRYFSIPIEAEGFSRSSSNTTLPRPKLRIANVGGLLSAEIAANDDLVGAKVIRRRTFAKYLDEINFPSGNPSANPDQFLPDEVWFVDQKTSENKYMIEWELASAFDLQDVKLPRRQIIQNGCPFGYRVWIESEGRFDYTSAGDCGYAGSAYYDKNDIIVTDARLDRCGKRLSSCEIRHPNADIPFGGFPGAVRLE